MQYSIAFSTADRYTRKSARQIRSLPNCRIFASRYLVCRGDSDMVRQSYDIFRRSAAGDHIWVETAHDLESAKSRIIELSAERPGQYVVFNQRSGRMVSSGTVVASPTARARSGDLQNSTEARNEPARLAPDPLWK